MSLDKSGMSLTYNSGMSDKSLKYNATSSNITKDLFVLAGSFYFHKLSSCHLKPSFPILQP